MYVCVLCVFFSLGKQWQAHIFPLQRYNSFYTPIFIIAKEQCL